MNFSALIGISIIAQLSFGQVDSSQFKLKTLPDSIDVNRSLRGENGEILIWAIHTDSLKQHYSKTVLLIKFLSDSLGNESYEISQLVTTDRNIEKWIIPTVYRHPPPNHQGPADPRHYTIRRQEIYTAIPSLRDLESVWFRGSAYFKSNQKRILIAFGINEVVWNQIFTRSPKSNDFKTFY
jgi:hypothetical protein